jgi:hypothetical protein
MANDSGGHASTPLMTIDIMLMDTENAFIEQAESSGGLSTSTLAFAAVGLVALFFVVLMLVGAISNKEEGTLAGVDFKALADDASMTTLEDGSNVWESSTGPEQSA